jgi:hypothetical protein
MTVVTWFARRLGGFQTETAEAKSESLAMA